MVKRFFLDRVDVGSDDLPVDVGDQLALAIFTYAADADLGGRDATTVGTEETLDAPLLQDAPKHGLFDHPNSPDFMKMNPRSLYRHPFRKERTLRCGPRFSPEERIVI
jgi:hypothetical protein